MSIREFIARDSVHYANLLAQRVTAAVELLASSPLMGRVVPEFNNPHVREVIVGSYRIVYRYEHDIVEIATISHGARLLRGRIS